MKEKRDEILLKIIDLYIKSGQPVSSKQLISEYKLAVSSATIRNIMADLENEGFLEKTHTSSGRIPSISGYKFFAEHSKSKTNELLESKLKEIFSKRYLSIDVTLDEAAKAINEIIGLTLVTSSNVNTEVLKSIQLIELNNYSATIILVTSTGQVANKTIDLTNFQDIKLEDVRIAIRLFKERLINTSLINLREKALALKPILSKYIKNYETILQSFIGNVFEFENKNHVYGKSNIIKQEGIDRLHLTQILDLIENNSIWNMIESKVEEDETLKIDVRNSNISLISKKIFVNNTTKEISVIGSNRMDYISAKSAIALLESFIKPKFSKKNN
ncbi:heat-inducible transcriptional repressor HrcA [[Mycoplasma] mobile]|nr:heat-inducible transcriptional repressor HrcA [[Mycoplasma] mobile]